MNPGEDWWVGAAGAAISALLGALIGSSIPLAWAWNARRIERKGELLAMQVELYQALIAMSTLRKDKVAAPLYRLPLTMFERALPKLIGEGKLKGNEVSGLLEFVVRAEVLNRGLDLASSAVSTGNMRAANDEYSRNLAKAVQIMDEKLERFDRLTVFDMASSRLFRLDGTLPLARKA